jgi:aminotransferase
MIRVEAPLRLTERVESVPPSGIRKFFDIVATMPEVISLGIGEPDFVTPAPILRAGKASLDAGKTGYTSNSGLIELRRALSDHLASRYGVRYDPETEILITVGVSEAVHVAALSLIAPGDEVLLPEPSFVAYPAVIPFADGRVVPVRTHVEDDFQLRAEALETAITPATRGLILSYPNNPTGAVMERRSRPWPAWPSATGCSCWPTRSTIGWCTGWSTSVSPPCRECASRPSCLAASPRTTR